MASPSDVLKMVKDGGYEFVDLRFCDLPGQVQHFTIPAAELRSVDHRKAVRNASVQRLLLQRTP